MILIARQLLLAFGTPRNEVVHVHDRVCMHEAVAMADENEERVRGTERTYKICLFIFITAAQYQ